MTGMVLRLAGPLQAWGEHSAFTHRDTLRFPSRSGLVGLFAAAMGLRRGEPLDRFHALRLTVRIDRPGVLLTDFHTVGGGRPQQQTVPTAEGKRRGPGMATVVTYRDYLADAVFTVAVEGPGELIAALATALQRPRWQPYLGRRSCPPDPPLLLRASTPDPVRELEARVPVPRRLRPGQPAELDFVTDGSGQDATAAAELTDVPETFARHHRRYRPRTVSIAPRPVLEALWCQHTRDYYDALARYLQEEGRT